MKDGKNETDRGRPQPWANAQGYMLSPLRGWRKVVQHQLLNGHSFVGPPQFVVLKNSTPRKSATSKLTLQKNAIAKLTPWARQLKRRVAFITRPAASAVGSVNQQAVDDFRYGLQGLLLFLVAAL